MIAYIDIVGAHMKQDMIGKRIIVVGGALPIITYTAQIFATEIRRFGAEVFYLDADEVGSRAAELIQFCTGGADMMLCINNVGLSLALADGSFLWDRFGIPCYDFLFDHPVHYMRVLNTENSVANLNLVCVDRNHVEYAIKYCSAVKKAYFMPLAGERQDINSWIPWNERYVSVLLVGGVDPIIPVLSGDDEGLLEYLFEHTDATIEDAMRDCLGVEGDRLCEHISVEKVVHSLSRFELIRCLLEAGIDVDVCGGGWDRTDFIQNEHFRYHGLVSPDECLEFLKRAKVSLSVMPWFKDGAHDRVYNSIMCGAVVVTNSSEYMMEDLHDGQELYTYDISDMSVVAQIVGEILEDERGCEELRTRAYDVVSSGHTWDVVMGNMLNMLT